MSLMWRCEISTSYGAKRVRKVASHVAKEKRQGIGAKGRGTLQQNADWLQK